eukprot:CAMPEP_0169072268 /NCGR_PEP_ID=MMETSP1015-20121227/6103_1 /TAXON_ID=342587 /ORGANISM="Karlodinium micrum, Strain CCMP2283" /LENGTH=133 /DNA_ID=CAMNT_0009131411 /DNA_START=24 /DNA_END=425 /DNA_ORIENTATION=-
MGASCHCDRSSREEIAEDGAASTVLPPAEEVVDFPAPGVAQDRSRQGYTIEKGSDGSHDDGLKQRECQAAEEPFATGHVALVLSHLCPDKLPNQIGESGLSRPRSGCCRKRNQIRSTYPKDAPKELAIVPNDL